MTAKEEAKDLVEKFSNPLDYLEVDSEPGGGGWITSSSTKEASKELALICVGEIEQYLTDYGKQTNELQNMDRTFAHLEEVKKEIELLK